MPMHPNSIANLEKGKRFSKTYKPANTGRRKSYLKEFVDSERISLADLKIIFENILMDYSFADIETIYNRGNKTLPVAIAGYLKAIITDLKKGRRDSIDALFNRIYGMPVQQINHFDKKSDIPDDPEERRALMEKIEKELALTDEEVIIHGEDENSNPNE